MSRILITGVAGFLGSHLFERLLAEGHSVIGVHKVVTGDTGNLEPVFYDDAFKILSTRRSEYIHVAGTLIGLSILPASPHCGPTMDIQSRP